MLKVLDLFSGIGGFSLGLERTGGFETVAFCEYEDFPRKVLAKHWPDVPCFPDVRTLKGTDIEGTVDVICGGFPCQDISVAGKQAGIADGTRSGLWSEIVRLAGELRPKYIIVENVANLLAGPSERRGGWFGRILGDLAECGYDAEWENIPAAALGAPHRRERVWIIAYPSGTRTERLVKGRSLSQIGPWGWRGETDLREIRPYREGDLWPKPLIRRMDDGVPDRTHRLKALGNAVVPQIPEMIGYAILEAELQKQAA
jgi:DNA (cytosine-5)-methyltransferase 1